MTPRSAGDQPRLVTPRFALVTAASLAYFLGIGMLIPTIPRFVDDELGGGGLAVGIVAGAFAFSAALLRPWAGRIGDMRGRRVLVMGGAAVLAASYVLYVFVDSLVPLVLLRVMSGVGEAGVFVGAATAIQDLAPTSRSGEAASYFSVAVYGGLGAGPPIGEAIQRAHGFDAVWLVAAAITAFAVVLGTWVPVGTTSRERRRLIHPAALGPGTAMLLSLSGLAAFTGFLALYVDHEDLGDAGPLFAVYGGLILAMRLLGARIADRFGAKQTATFAVCCISAGVLLMGLLASRPGLFAGTAVFSVGMALQYPALIRLVIERTPEDQRSSAIATLSIFFDLSQGLGLFLLGGIVAVGGERSAFLAAAALSLCALGALFRLGAPRRAGRDGPTPVVVEGQPPG